jgi:hypothetical protein
MVAGGQALPTVKTLDISFLLFQVDDKEECDAPIGFGNPKQLHKMGMIRKLRPSW